MSNLRKIPIAEAAMIELERLYYIMSSYMQVITYLSTVDKVNDGVLSDFVIKYQNSFMEFHTALNEVVRMYVPDTDTVNNLISPNFLTSELEISPGKMCGYNET